MFNKYQKQIDSLKSQLEYASAVNRDERKRLVEMLHALAKEMGYIFDVEPAVDSKVVIRKR